MAGALCLQGVLSGELSHRFFLTRPPEPSPEMLLSPPSESIYVGKTKLLHAPFFWNPKKLVNPHICVSGITGSGKSYFVKTFVTRASLVFGASALIIDWAGEYAEWVRAAGGRVVSFGEDGINLLDLGGSTPHIRAQQVMASLEILTDISQFPAQRRLTESAIEQAYASRGFFPHIQNSAKKAPTLQDVLQGLLKKSRKDAEAPEAARRVKNLILSSGNSFCRPGIRLESLLSGLVCVDLHSLPTESLRSLAGLAILQFVKEKMRKQCYRGDSLPRLFVVADEAWKIAADERSDIVSIVREGRKYGFGLIVASQNPTDVHRSIFSNAGTVIAFRLTLAPERSYIRESLSYSDFYEKESHSMAVGQALVHLEFSKPASCPKTFIISHVDGEEMLVTLSLRGGGMNLEFERGELSRKLLSFGLSDKQLASVLVQFERSNYSLEDWRFAEIIEAFGHSRASTISLLRNLGAEESGLLQMFSSMEKRRAHDGAKEAIISLQASSSVQRGHRAASRERVRSLPTKTAEAVSGARKSPRKKR
jgi:hypothetical protein